MSRQQLFVVGTAIFLFLGLYFGCNTKPQEQKIVEKARSLTLESTDVKSLVRNAKDSLSVAERSEVMTVEAALNAAKSDADKVEQFKLLSQKWYQFGNAAVAGHYAEEIATIENTEQAWSIAGTTYSIAVQRTKVEKIREFCANRAIRAFENAISINPTNTTHQVNLALCYTEYPLKENPMKGIQMLLELNKKDPKNISVLNTLARLGLQTGQYEKAAKRLEVVLSLDANNQKATCLLAQAYQGLGNTDKAAAFNNKCQLLQQK
ncbi:MAG: tetratricopeptide repeat protein [Saprospiraceae bacterium]